MLPLSGLSITNQRNAGDNGPERYRVQPEFVHFAATNRWIGGGKTGAAAAVKTRRRAAGSSFGLKFQPSVKKNARPLGAAEQSP